MPQSNPASAIFVTRLCHTGDCCPELHILPDEPHDSCIRITDDHGNQAIFGLDTVFSTPLRPTPASDELHELHGPFDELVYMTPDQHSALFKESVIQDLREEAERRGFDFRAIEAARTAAMAV